MLVPLSPCYGVSMCYAISRPFSVLFRQDELSIFTLQMNWKSHKFLDWVHVNCAIVQLCIKTGWKNGRHCREMESSLNLFDSQTWYWHFDISFDVCWSIQGFAFKRNPSPDYHFEFTLFKIFSDSSDKKNIPLRILWKTWETFYFQTGAFYITILLLDDWHFIYFLASLCQL